MAKGRRNTVSSKEIAIAANNLVALASRSEALLHQDVGRARRVRDYVVELETLLHEDVMAGYLTAQELVQVFASCALVTHCLRVQQKVSGPILEDLLSRMAGDVIDE